MSPLLCYILIMNLIAFVIFGIDKWLAVSNKNRVSEKTLLTLSFIGGSMGALVAMLLFRHKIAKRSFLWKFAGLVVLQIGILIVLNTNKFINYFYPEIHH